MEKLYTRSEYFNHFSVDIPTRKKINKLSLLQSRSTGENGIARSEKKPLNFWRELHLRADKSRRIPSLFFSVPCYIRKTLSMKGEDPREFYYFMKENFKSFKAKHRYGDAYDDLVFLFADLQAGAAQFLNKAESQAPQKRPETSAAPETINTCTFSGNTTMGSLYVTVPERGPSMVFPLAYGFFLGVVVAAAVVILNVYC